MHFSKFSSCPLDRRSAAHTNARTCTEGYYGVAVLPVPHPPQMNMHVCALSQGIISFRLRRDTILSRLPAPDCLQERLNSALAAEKVRHDKEASINGPTEM